ncbi:MAG: DMT family transporter [Kiritimatiellae bacterium]|jgi:drug/metabolite transporter (DMT)-like permease|nr:DMT family transporter [Kiritimatiellia bacterium]
MTNRTKAVFCIIASAFGFALMAAFVRLCDGYGAEISSFQKAFFRNSIAFVIAVFVFCRNSGTQRLKPFISRRAAAVLLLRSIVGTAGIFANFYALGKIPISDAQTLNKTAPFFTVLFAWIFLGERMTRRQMLAIAAAFAGVVLVAKPGFEGVDGFAVAMGLFGGVAAGGAYACLRKLGIYKLDGAFIVLFFSAFSCCASLPFILTGFTPMTAEQVLVLSGAGIGAAIGQFGITAAYRFSAPGSVAVFDYTNIIFTAALGFMFFGQIPDRWSVMGYAAIVMAAMVMRKKG